MIPAEWVREFTRRRIAIRDSKSDYGEHGYGYLWWHDRYRTPAGELDVHTAVGNGAQRVFVIPSLRMLVVHLAGRYNDPDAAWIPERLLLEHILPAMESGPAQAQAEASSRAGPELASRIDSLHERPTLASGDTVPYAFGLQHGEYRGLPMVHRGGGGGFSTELMRFPGPRFAVATLCNADASHPLFLSRAVVDLFLGDAMQVAAKPATLSLDVVEPPRGEPDRYAGDYRTRDVPWNLLRLVAPDGALWEVFPDRMLQLTRLRDGRYHADGHVYAFSRPTAGRSLRLELSWPDGGGWGTEVLERIPDAERWRPDALALEPYAGTFHSPDLNVSWELAVRGGELILRRRRAVDLALAPVEPDIMTGMLGTYDRPIYVGLLFGRDAAGAVTHFTVSTPPGIDAIRGLRFERE